MNTKTFALLFFACLLAGCATPPPAPPGAGSPHIVPATEWGAIPSDPAKARRHEIRAITLHHQGESWPPGRDPREYLRSLQKWSRAEKKWLDIPYHYVIDLEGVIYEARDIAFAGDTNTEYDPAGHALIEVVGNFELVEPNAAQLEAVASLMAHLARKHNVPPSEIRGHRDVSAQTVCPGKNLYRYLQNGYFRERVAAALAQPASR